MDADSVPHRTTNPDPAWENVALSQPVSGIPVFTADQNGIAYRLAYRAEKDHLVVTAEMENRTGQPFRAVPVTAVFGNRLRNAELSGVEPKVFPDADAL